MRTRHQSSGSLSGQFPSLVIVEAWLARSGHFITVNAVALNGRDNQAEEPLAVPERRSAMEHRLRVSTMALRPVHAATRLRTD